MKRRKKPLVYGIWLALVLFLCVPALSGARAEDEQTFEIPITKTTDAYGDNGKVIGVLRPVGDGRADFAPVKGGEAFGVQVLYTYTGDSEMAKDGDLAGKTKVTLCWASEDKVGIEEQAAPATEQNGSAAPSSAPEENVTEEQSAAPVSLSTPEPTPALEPEVPDHVWIDTELIINALMDIHTDDALTIALRDEQIAALQAVSNIGDQTPEGEPSQEEAIEANGEQRTENAVNPLFQSVYFYMIGTLVTVFLGIIAVSKFTKKKQPDASSRNQTSDTLGTEIKNGLKPLEEIRKTIDNMVSSMPTEKKIEAVKDDTEKLVSEADQTSKKLDQVVDLLEKKVIPPPPDGIQPDIFALLKEKLAGNASREEWIGYVVGDAKLNYVLLQESVKVHDAWNKIDTGGSILACLTRNPGDTIGYLIPSYNDPKAQENRWEKFYDIEEDNSVIYYKIDLLAVMNIDEDGFYTIRSRGKLIRGV